jgi:hypothetical protein
MAASLTTHVSNIQASLGDDGTLFTLGICTAAVRLALEKFNERAPIYAGTLVTVVNGDVEYALNESDFTNLIDILDVVVDDESVAFQKYYFDNAPFIRLDEALVSGDLDVRYTLPHTVSGLDSATQSTLDSNQDKVLLAGACAFAIYIRAAARVESFNLDKNVMSNYEKLAGPFLQAFASGLNRYAARNIPQADRDTRAWDDVWHNFGE